MYSKKLRKREQTFIQSPQEPVKKKAPIGKYIYLTILAIIVISISKLLIEKVVFNQGIGFLEAEAIYIEANQPGRILNINYAINDTVDLKNPVVILDKSWASDSPNGINDLNNNYYTNERRRINTEKEIAILRLELARKKENFRKLKDEQIKAQNLFYANAMIRSELSAIETKLNNTKAEISKQKIEFEAAQKRLSSYKSQRHSLYNPASGNGAVGGNLLYATRSGIVSRIFKNKGEVVKLGEPILKLRNPDNEMILTYFKAGTENNIFKGDNARIYFANGDWVNGVVSKIYSSTAEQPPEIKRKFGKVQRFIIAEIIPNTPLSNRVFETQVDVYITKKWFQSIFPFI